MKYFLDTEFIEGFHKHKGRFRHHVDLISIGICCEDGRELHLISNEYDFAEASEWVVKNVIEPLYIQTVHGDARNHCNVTNFHKHFGKRDFEIRNQLNEFFNIGQPCSVEIFGYYADYDWVAFCSIFGAMIHLPKILPMYCTDLKQMMDERGLTKEWKKENCPDPDNEHNALSDAKWNKRLYDKIIPHPLIMIH